MSNILQQRAVLMRLSGGVPGQHRKDKNLSAQVKSEKHLGDGAGKWIKDLWPADAMAGIKAKINEAREYHNTVTLPFGVRGDDDEGATPAIAGIGILPAALISEYGDKMRQFKGELDFLVAEFLKDPQQYIDWAFREHNGTFDPKNYPGCFMDCGVPKCDASEFREVMGKKFYLRTEPLPVPDAAQFTETITNLLGVDAQSVDIRVRDAAQEAQRELMRRMIEPVRAMVAKLNEQPKNGKDDIVFRDTLIGNISDIVQLAPKLNLAGDSQVDSFVKEMEVLIRYTPKVLRDDKATRAEAAKKAQEVFDRLTSYKL